MRPIKTTKKSILLVSLFSIAAIVLILNVRSIRNWYLLGGLRSDCDLACRQEKKEKPSHGPVVTNASGVNAIQPARSTEYTADELPRRPELIKSIEAAADATGEVLKIYKDNNLGFQFSYPSVLDLEVWHWAPPNYRNFDGLEINIFPRPVGRLDFREGVTIYRLKTEVASYEELKEKITPKGVDAVWYPDFKGTKEFNGSQFLEVVSEGEGPDYHSYYLIENDVLYEISQPLYEYENPQFLETVINTFRVLN